MKKVILILVIAFTVFRCSDKDQFVGSGETTSEIRHLDYINKISSEGTFIVTITKGNEQMIEIIADDNIMHRVRTDVTNGKLKLYLADGSYNNIHLEANITILELNEIENSGDGDMHIYNNTNVESFKVYNNGSASIYLDGSCENLDIETEGSGPIFAYNMETENCDIEIEGSSDVEVSCDSNLDITIEGSGNVYYKGAPLINTNISGSGQVINDN